MYIFCVYIVHMYFMYPLWFCFSENPKYYNIFLDFSTQPLPPLSHVFWLKGLVPVSESITQ